MVIGITGAIGCGKSALRKLLEKHHFAVLDADLLAHELYRPDSPVLSLLVRRWGSAFLSADGTLDRAKVAALVFADPAELRFLNETLQPFLKTALQDKIQAAKAAEQTLFVELPLLFEYDLAPLLDGVLAVSCADDLRHRRLRERGLSDAQISAREAAQYPPEQKCDRADWVLINDGELNLLEQQCLVFLKKLKLI